MATATPTAAPHYVTTGVIAKVGQDAYCNRMEIYDFVAEKNHMQFSLYVQALRAMYDVAEDDKLSYYQIAGIHGVPNIPWDGAGASGGVQAQWLGYCTHGTVLFPTWHSPYVALIEQIIQGHAVDIANTYTTSDKDKWQVAASRLRQPYWDWARTALPPDQIYKDDTVKITIADGTQKDVLNPFRFYPFKRPSTYNEFPPPYNGWNRTARHAVVLPDGEIADDIASLERSLTSNKGTRTTETFVMLMAIKDWAKFTNNSGGTSPEPYAGSLEKAHDNVHYHVGGGMGKGDMSDAAVAAFDPIFFLHHSQTDRLLSLWAAINYNQWVIPDKAYSGTFTIPQNSDIDEDTDLTPFWRLSTEKGSLFWKSADFKLAMATEGMLGYSYPEFDGLNRKDKAAVSAAILKKVGELYTPTIQTWFDFAAKSHLPNLSAQIPRLVANPTPAPAALTVLSWAVHVTVKKYALGHSFAVSVFVGDVPDDPTEWRSAPSYAGDFCTFVNSAAKRCSNCVAHIDMDDKGMVYLNDALIASGRVRSLEAEDVVPYLRRELQWRVHSDSGPAYHPSTVEGLRIEVVARPVEWAKGAPVPTLGEVVQYPEITRGLPGGCQ